MIRVTKSIAIDESDIVFVFSRASGPGGQNVNKVATAVQLRFDVAGSSTLPRDVKERLTGLAGARMTKDGILVINARRHRTQDQNRADALKRLVALVRKAAERPKRRVATRPTRESREKRIAEKKRRSRVKRDRGQVGEDE